MIDEADEQSLDDSLDELMQGQEDGKEDSDSENEVEINQDLVDGENLLQNDQAKIHHNNTDFKGNILIADD